MEEGLKRKRAYKIPTPDEQLLELTQNSDSPPWKSIEKLLKKGASLDKPDLYRVKPDDCSSAYKIFSASPSEQKMEILSQISPERIDAAELPNFLFSLIGEVPSESALAFIERLPHKQIELKLPLLKKNTLEENLQILKALREKEISIKNSYPFFTECFDQILLSTPEIAIEYVTEYTYQDNPRHFEIVRFLIRIMIMHMHDLSKGYTLQILKYLFHTHLKHRSLNEIDAAWRQVKPYPFGGLVLTLLWLDTYNGFWLVKTAAEQSRRFSIDLTCIYLRYPDFAALQRYSSHFVHSNKCLYSLNRRYANQKKLQQAIRFVCKRFNWDINFVLFLASIIPSKFRDALKKGHSPTCALIVSCSDDALKNSVLESFILHELFTMEDCRLILKPILPESCFLDARDQDVDSWSGIAWFILELKITKPLNIHTHLESSPPSIDVLFHLFMDHIDTAAFAYHAQSMSWRQSLQFMVSLFYNPKHASAFFQKFHRLRTIEVRDGGRVTSDWEPFLDMFFYSLPQYPHLAHACMTEFEQELRTCKNEYLPKGSIQWFKQMKEEGWSRFESKYIPKISTHWFKRIKKEGWSMHKHQGRTTLFKHPERAEVLAVKWQKLDESPDSLIRESETIRFLHQNYEELGLRSEYPTSHGVVQFVGRMTDDMLDSIELPLEMDKDSSTNAAYIYTCPTDSYFSYLSSSEVDSETFQKGRMAALHDLHVLARSGLIMTSLADLFHNRTNNENRWDKGRYIVYPGLLMGGWRRGRGSGRIDKFEKAVEYVNIRSSGLADVGDSEFINALNDAEHPFVKRFLPSMHNLANQTSPTNMVATLFLGEYSLVDELVLGVWLKKRDQLDWKDDVKVTELQKRLLQGGACSFSVFSKQPVWRTARFMDSVIDMKRYSRQMHFWMNENSYRPFITQRSLPTEIYDPQTSVTVDSTGNMRGWKNGLGFAYDGVNPDLGTVNGPYPIKEGEKWRNLGVPYMLMLRAAAQLSRQEYKDAIISVTERKWEAAAAHLQELLLYNYYSTAAYKLLAGVYNKLNLPEKSAVCMRQWAALTLQARWRKGKKTAFC
jgi:hypothetical protein